MSITQAGFEGNEHGAIKILLEHGAIEECPMDKNIYHDTGKYTIESLNEIPVPEWMLAIMRRLLRDCPLRRDCPYCHSKEEDTE